MPPPWWSAALPASPASGGRLDVVQIHLPPRGRELIASDARSCRYPIDWLRQDDVVRLIDELMLVIEIELVALRLVRRAAGVGNRLQQRVGRCPADARRHALHRGRGPETGLRCV